jgi:hypothetical protein
MADAKDALVKLAVNQTNPYDAKGADFKAGGPKGAAVGQAEGQDKLIADSVNQCGPRHTEDGGAGAGYGTPVPGDRSRVIASNFKVSANDAEGGTKVSQAMDVDLASGKWTSSLDYKN